MSRAAWMIVLSCCLLSLTGCGPGWVRPYSAELPADYQEQDRLRLEGRSWEGVLVARARSRYRVQPTIIVIARDASDDVEEPAVRYVTEKSVCDLDSRPAVSVEAEYQMRPGERDSWCRQRTVTLEDGRRRFTVTLMCSTDDWEERNSEFEAFLGTFRLREEDSTDKLPVAKFVALPDDSLLE